MKPVEALILLSCLLSAVPAASQKTGSASDLGLCRGFSKQNDASKQQLMSFFGFYLLGVRDERQAACSEASKGSGIRIDDSCVLAETAQSVFEATSAAKIHRLEKFCELHPDSKISQAFYAVSVFGTNNDELWNLGVK